MSRSEMTSIADSSILIRWLGERPRQRRPARDEGSRPGVIGGDRPDGLASRLVVSLAHGLAIAGSEVVGAFGSIPMRGALR